MKTLTRGLNPDSLKAALEAASTPAFKLTFSLLLILAALGATYLDSRGNFPGIELRDVLIRGLLVSSILLFSALALAKRSRIASNVALALVTLLGIFTAYLVHTDLFYPQNRAWLAIACIAALFALFVANRLMDDFRWGGLTLTSVASIPLILLIWSQVWPMATTGIGTPGGLLYWGNPLMWIGLLGVSATSMFAAYLMSRMAGASQWGGFALLAVAAFLVLAHSWLDGNYGEGSTGYYADGWEGHPQIQPVRFDQSPNIYFVGFDALTPESLAQRHMGIVTTDLHQMMREEMRTFRNLFANGGPTKSFYRALMALDLQVMLEHRSAVGAGPRYFAGHDLSPLVWLLRINGYETTTIFNDTFFGYRKGQGIDNYTVNREVAVCSRLDHLIRPWAFWGFCWNRGDEADLSKGDFIVRELSRVDTSNPQFVIAYLLLPGHTPLIFDNDDKRARVSFIERYKENSNEAASYLEEIIDHIKVNDPEAILFVHGDHGAWLSRGMEIEDDPTFFLQDRFGILGGIYPPDRCSAELDEAESKGYVTSLDIVHAILECLSGGQSPLREPRNDRFWGSGVPEDHSYKYEDFLYE